MATEVIAGKFATVRGAPASKGLSLSTTVAYQVIPSGTQWVQLIGTTYSTAVVARFLFNPWLTVIKTTDLLATTANTTDGSVNVQDGTAATVLTLNSLDTLANLGALYIGSWDQFSGVVVDVTNTNSNASVLTVEYWNGTAWADTSATDGTASGGATFAQDGNVTWTVPTAWATTPLADAVSTAEKNIGEYRAPLFWTRWKVSAALDSTVSVTGMLAINKSTAYAEIPASLPWEQGVKVGPGGVSCIQSLTDAGTALLLINCSSQGRMA